MKLSIQNNGDGFAIIKVSIPEFMLPSFMQFIDNQRKYEKSRTPLVNKDKLLRDEEYFIRMNTAAKTFFDDSIFAGNPVNVAISQTLQQMKGASFYNITYDSLKSILSRQGCFRPKKS